MMLNQAGAISEYTAFCYGVKDVGFSFFNWESVYFRHKEFVQLREGILACSFKGIHTQSIGINLIGRTSLWGLASVSQGFQYLYLVYQGYRHPAVS